MPTSETPIPRVHTSQPVIALTFDDGPHVTNTARMIELFEREKIKVTFFEIGNNVSEHPELARAVVAAGHEIGNHSMSHRNLGEMEDIDVVRAEVEETQSLIGEITGFRPVVFRAPFLSHGSALATVLDELKLPSIGGITAADWDAATTAEEIVETCSNVGPGDIVLLHTWPKATMQALPEIIINLRAKGLRFVTISELIASRELKALMS